MFNVSLFQCWPVEAGSVTSKSLTWLRVVQFISVLACGSRLCHTRLSAATPGVPRISVLACGSRLCHSRISQRLRRRSTSFQCWPVEAGSVTSILRSITGFHPDFSAGLWKQALSRRNRSNNDGVSGYFSASLWKQALSQGFQGSLLLGSVISVLACGSRLCHMRVDFSRGEYGIISVLACGSRLCHRQKSLPLFEMASKFQCWPVEAGSVTLHWTVLT